MKILAIETCCDETAIAVLEITGPKEKPEIEILGNTLLSQMHLHAEYGGVYPNLAKREHQKNLPILLEEITKHRPQITKEIDFIAVTSGPGLEPALWTGITFAEDLGKKWGKPVVPVNHMEGHIWSVLYKGSRIKDEGLKLPALALLISGGHTELVHVKDFGNYEIIGRTLDDAAGEAFDKVARMLGLSYPGGPKISALAAISRKREGDFRASRTATAGVERADRALSDSALRKSSFRFPRPMINSGDLNFSFSGLKTAVLYKLRDNKDLPKELVAKEFEDAVVEVLVEKTKTALEMLGVKTLIIAGGVSGNTYLRERFKEELPDCTIHFPTPLLITDNAIMIGIAGYIQASINPAIVDKKVLLAAHGNLSLDNRSGGDNWARSSQHPS